MERLALVTTAWARVDARRRSVDAALLGAASGLAVLARLDLALVIWLIPAALILRTRCWRLLAPWLGAASAVAGPFFLWNWWRFGHLLPVSGTVKLRDLNHYVAERFGSRLSISYLRFLGSLLRTYWQALEAVLGAEVAQVMASIHDWWRANQQAGKCSVIFGYPLGKLQRVLVGLDTGIGPVFCHGAVEKMNDRALLIRSSISF